MLHIINMKRPGTVILHTIPQLPRSTLQTWNHQALLYYIQSLSYHAPHYKHETTRHCYTTYNPSATMLHIINMKRPGTVILHTIPQLPCCTLQTWNDQALLYYIQSLSYHAAHYKHETTRHCYTTYNPSATVLHITNMKRPGTVILHTIPQLPCCTLQTWNDQALLLLHTIPL